jgi:hypothetical protein
MAACRLSLTQNHPKFFLENMGFCEEERSIKILSKKKEVEDWTE